jgi:DNA-binding response OmpR family regulator
VRGVPGGDDEARRVLVIDDSELVREVAILALELAGFAVEQAADSQAGLRAAIANPPDGILLDVVMPGTDGVATLVALRADARTAAVPIAFLTGLGVDPGERDRLLALGAQAVIPKPFAVSALAGAVRDAFGWDD